MFGNQENDRIFAVHCCPEQTGGIFRRARNDHTKSWIMRERRFVSLAMPQTSARQIRSVWRVDHRGTFPIAKRSPPQDRDVCDQLIEAGIDEIDELNFEDWTLAIGRNPAGNPEDGRFSQGRIKYLFRKFS